MLIDYPFFGAWVRALREARDLTLEALANAIGYAPTTLRQVESGLRTPSEAVAEALAKYLLDAADRPAFLARAEEARRLATGRSTAPRTPDGPRVPSAPVEDRLPAAPPRPPHLPPAPYLTPPRPPQDILGRETEVTAIRQLLCLNSPDVHEVAPLALIGTGGIGKTTLAIAVGRLPGIRERFPDGVLWIQLGPKPTLRNLLDAWGRALDVNVLAEPDEAAAADRLRSALFDRRALLIVDDVWDAAHAQWFNLAGPDGRWLVTTRDSAIAYAVATPERTLRVGALAPEAALSLLRHLAPQAVAGREAAAHRLCERLGYLPLALTLAGRQLALDAEVPGRLERRLAELETDPLARLKLAQPEGRPGLAEDRPASLAAILGLSLTRLDAVDQERFAALSVFGGEPADWAVAAAAGMWGCGVEEAEPTVMRLVQRGLVERRGDRYALHTLLAAYAEALARKLNL
ncbi:MAG: helix-turn-helix domain-containing protein [Anaerolineae bacterium]|nr:helix-turn-helix domain-containing protein [Anaerolineae bacterium]